MCFLAFPESLIKPVKYKKPNIPLIPLFGFGLGGGGGRMRKKADAFYKFGVKRKIKVLPLTQKDTAKIIKGLIPYSRKK